jgi:hypothetical protein
VKGKNMLTEEEHAEIRQRINGHREWLDSIRDQNGWASYAPEDKPTDVPDATNEERSAVELYEFMTDPPARYALYINEKTRKATTWTGDILGDAYFGTEWRDNFGGLRVSIDVVGINGIHYYGTYYKSAGNYARITARKNQP